MTAAANVITRPCDWRVWAPGFALPAACMLGDYATGEHVLWQNPAAFLTLMAIGMGALALARRRRRVGLQYLTIGPLWVAAFSMLAIGAFLALLALVGFAFAADALKKLQPVGVLILLCSLLALTPLWTGAIYAMGAMVVTRQQNQTRGRLKTIVSTLLGAVATICVIIALASADNDWVEQTIDNLEQATPAAWEATFRSLGSYPLCGRKRCTRLVCSKLLQGSDHPTSTIPFPPQPELDAVFTEAFGQSVQQVCLKLD